MKKLIILPILAFSISLFSQDHPFRVFTPTPHVDNLSRGGGIDTTEKIVTVEAMPVLKISRTVIKKRFLENVWTFVYQRSGEKRKVFEGNAKQARLARMHLNDIETPGYLFIEDEGEISFMVRCRCE